MAKEDDPVLLRGLGLFLMGRWAVKSLVWFLSLQLFGYTVDGSEIPRPTTVWM